MSTMLKSICDLCESSMTHEAEHHQASDCTHDELMLYFSYMHSVPKAGLEAPVTKTHAFCSQTFERRGKQDNSLRLAGSNEACFRGD